MTIMQMSELSINLGGMTMLVGGLLLPFYWVHFNLTITEQYGYIAVYACTAFFAYRLKRNRIVIDQSRREVRIRACWCFLFWKEELTYAFETLRRETFDYADGSGINLQLTCPDGNRVAVYDGRAIQILLVAIPG
jgi:hypothetical protein